MPRADAAWFGILNANKPTGVTSRDVVNQVQRLVRPAKVGHAGTLDPLASGVLVVCVGPATRLIAEVQRQQKHYEADFLLGCTSETDDVEGQVIENPDVQLPTRAEIERALPRFVGHIEQTPPQYSAVKVQGRRAYDLARKGQQVKLQPRPVRVDALEVLAHQQRRLTLRIGCGSGVYVRSLGRDLGQLLGCGAVMSRLVRTRIGDFALADAVDPGELTAEDLARQLLSPLTAIPDLPQLPLAAQLRQQLGHGQTVACDQARAGQRYAVIDERGRLTTIADAAHSGQLQAQLNFPV